MSEDWRQCVDFDQSHFGCEAGVVLKWFWGENPAKKKKE